MEMPEWQRMELHPIGVVRNGCQKRPEQHWEGIVSEIQVRPELAEGLEGLEQFSHVLVVFWFDRVEEYGARKLRIHPMGRKDLPEVGLFATRSPHRPNPIGVTAVRLLGIEGNVLRVKGLDALDGTPVLDLKPYLTRGDLWPEATHPEWIDRFWASQDEEKQ